MPKVAQRVPKGCPKGFPKGFQGCQRGPKRVPKGCPKVFPKGSQTVPKGPGLGCLMTGCLWKWLLAVGMVASGIVPEKNPSRILRES